MTKIDPNQIPADLTWVAQRLEEERPTATPLELDGMKLQAEARAKRGAPYQAKGRVLKSRVAITAILLLGLLTGGTGTTLALTEGSDSAARVQYPNETPRTSQVLGNSEESGPDRAAPGAGGPQVLGATESRGEAAQPGGDAAQGSRQVVATKGGENLPFTGLAAVPLIVLGLALLGTGAMLYRSVR